MLRVFAIVANVLFLLFVALEFFDRGAPSGNDAGFAHLLILMLVLNIAAILSSYRLDWVSLYLQRKALEEKAKIAALRSKEL